MFYESIEQMLNELKNTLCNERYTILTYISTTKVTKRRVINMLENDITVLHYERFISFINTFLLDPRKISKLETYISPESITYDEYIRILSTLENMSLLFALTDYFITMLGNNINPKFKLKYYEKIKSILTVKQLYDTFTKFSVDTLFDVYSNHINKFITHDTKHIISTDDLSSLNMTIEKLFSIYNKFTYKLNKPFFSKYVAIEIQHDNLVVHYLLPNFNKLQFIYAKSENEHIKLEFPDYHYAYFKINLKLSRTFGIEKIYMRVLNKNSFEDESQINLQSANNVDLIQEKSIRFPFNTYLTDSGVCLGDISKEVYRLTAFDIGNAISMILLSGLNDDLTDRETIDRIKQYEDSDIYYLRDSIFEEV